MKRIFLLTFIVKFGEIICYRKINPTKSQALVAGSDSDADVTICDSAHISICLCSQSGGSDSIGLLTEQLWSCD